MRVVSSFAVMCAVNLVGVVLGAEADSGSVPNGYELVFEEDFSGDASADRFAFSSRDHWKRVKVGDRFALEHRHAGAKGYRPPHRSPHNIALVATHRFGSFVLDYEVQQTSREYGHRDACVFFNFVDPAHFYYIHVASATDPHAHQIFTVDEADRTAITAQGTKGFEWGEVDQWHKVRVVRDLDSGSIQVFVDDMSKPIMVASDKSHGMGFIGFGSFDDSGRVTKIRIHAPDAVAASPKFFVTE